VKTDLQRDAEPFHAFWAIIPTGSAVGAPFCTREFMTSQ